MTEKQTIAHHCCGASSDTELAAPALDGAATNVPDGSSLTPLRIAQMDCPTEETLIRRKLGGMGEVQGLEFNLMQRVLTVAHKSDTLPAIQAAIREIGMDSENIDDASGKASGGPEPTRPWWPFAVGGAVALSAEILRWSGIPEWAGALLALSAVAILGVACFILLRTGSKFDLPLQRLDNVGKRS